MPLDGVKNVVLVRELPIPVPLLEYLPLLLLSITRSGGSYSSILQHTHLRTYYTLTPEIPPSTTPASCEDMRLTSLIGNRSSPAKAASANPP